jgi:hypothetical protein
MAEVQLSTVVVLDNVKMKWREQYVSEGLNRKIAPTQPPGIYQGLKIVENTGLPRQIEIAPDADTNFHMAVYQSTTGYSLTYWDQAGTSIILNLIDIDLSNQETIIGLEMDYTIGVDTTAVWMAFPVADWDALPAARRDEIIVLGTVQVPSSMAANIVTADISYERTTWAWRGLSKGSIPWSPLLRNGDFEQAETGNEENTWYWEHRQGQYQMTLHTSATDPYSGAHCLELDYQIQDDTVDGRIRQNVSVPVVPGQLIMVRVRKKVLIANTQGPEVYLEFLGTTGSLSTFMTIEIGPSDAIDASYQEFVETFEVPAGAYAIRSIQLGLDDKYQSSGTTGVHVRIDDVQVYLETLGERNDLQHGVSGDLEVAGILSLRDVLAGGVGGGLYNDSSVRADYTASTNKLQFRDREFGALTLDVSGTLEANAVDTGTLDTTGAAHVGTDLTVDRTSILGVDQLGSVSAAGVPRVTAAASLFAGVEYTLLWESVSAGGVAYRKYVSNTVKLLETINAVWDNSTNLWSKDIANSQSSLRQFDRFTEEFWVKKFDEDTPWAHPSGWTYMNPQAERQVNIAMCTGRAGYDTIGGYYQNTSTDGGNWASKSSGGTKQVDFQLPLLPGDRITELYIWGTAGNAAGEELQAKIYRVSGTGGSNVQISTTKTSTLTNGLAQVSWSSADAGIPEVTQDLNAYICKVRLPQTSGNGEVNIFGMLLTYDRQFPE